MKIRKEKKLKTYIKRIKRLRKYILSYPPTIKAERDELVTCSYQETEGKPTVIRRALALKKVLSNISIGIGPDELIVGRLAGESPRCVALYPELSVEWKKNELDSFERRSSDRFFISEEDKRKYHSIFQYWEGKTVQDSAIHMLPSQVLSAMNEKYPVFDVNLHMSQSGLGHVAPGYEIVLKHGFEGIKRKAKMILETINLSDPNEFQKSYFLQAIDIICDAIKIFADRYSEMAMDMAKGENDSKRKSELQKIAQVCKRVPFESATSFWEALQVFWFIHLVTQIETDGTAISPGRFDRYTYPYYEQDLNKGIIKQEQAQELIDCLFIKCNEILKVWSEESAKGFGGFPISQNLCVGGQNSDGEDSTNCVSFMALNSLDHVRLPQPALSVRLHKGTQEEFLHRVCEIIRLGLGMPAVYNDEVIIPAVMSRNIPLSEARDYCIVGCVEPSLNGKDWPRSNGGFFNLAKVLELALNDGICRLSGNRVGLRTGDPRNFKSLKDVIHAYKMQMEHFVELSVIANNVIESAHSLKQPMPFLSSLIEDCIEKGLDVTEGGARYNATGPLGVGLANVADSLGALEKLVFKSQVIAWDALDSALDRNYEGFEEIRSILKNQAPKYGNDTIHVDIYAKIGASIFCNEIKKYTNTAGGKYEPALIPVSGNVPLGKVVGALPDGRLATTPLAEGISPSQGCDINGPTAVLHSAAILEHELYPLGILLNQKFSPDILEGDRGIVNFASFLKAFLLLKLQHIQFNVISTDMLQEAQRKPEEYKNLVVRVAGYSAFFNDLDRSIQDDIISRTEQTRF